MKVAWGTTERPATLQWTDAGAKPARAVTSPRRKMCHSTCLQCAARSSAKAATPEAPPASSICSCDRPAGPRHWSASAGLYGGHS